MAQTIQSILSSVVGVLGLILYYILMVIAMPKILNNHSSIRTTSDRGLKKFLYPNGRAVVYETHPNIRKYVPQYLLYTEDGYKYLTCKLDESVKHIEYSVVMFNNRDRVLDVIEVDERNISSEESRRVMLHSDTSYIALSLNKVNGIALKRDTLMQCHFWQLGVYSAAIAVVGFVAMFLFLKMVENYDKTWLHMGIVNLISWRELILPSVAIALIVGFLVFRRNLKKGVRWSK